MSALKDYILIPTPEDPNSLAEFWISFPSENIVLHCARRYSGGLDFSCSYGGTGEHTQGCIYNYGSHANLSLSCEEDNLLSCPFNHNIDKCVAAHQEQIDEAMLLLEL